MQSVCAFVCSPKLRIQTRNVKPRITAQPTPAPFVCFLRLLLTATAAAGWMSLAEEIVHLRDAAAAAAPRCTSRPLRSRDGRWSVVEEGVFLCRTDGHATAQPYAKRFARRTTRLRIEEFRAVQEGLFLCRKESSLASEGHITRRWQHQAFR